MLLEKCIGYVNSVATLSLWKKILSLAERQRIGNSLTRLMVDRGLLVSAFTSEDLNSICIPPPPSMPLDELIDKINQLNLDLTILQRNCPNIIWDSNPLSISGLPGYNSLLDNEVQVASKLRLTPTQYLTGKFTLISTARRYKQRRFPFRKSDAQKHLGIDVNKASKLWEFFSLVGWI